MWRGDSASIQHHAQTWYGSTNRESLTLLYDFVADYWDRIALWRRRFTASVVHGQFPAARGQTFVRVYIRRLVLDVLSFTSRMSHTAVVCRIRMNYLIASFHFLSENHENAGSLRCNGAISLANFFSRKQSNLLLPPVTRVRPARL